MFLKHAEQPFIIAVLRACRIGARDGNQRIADIKSLPRQPAHIDEIDDKALVAAHKQPGGKLCLNLVKLAIGDVLLPVLHMKTQHMFGTVYIGNIRKTEQELLSVGYDRQGFLRGGYKVRSLCQRFRQIGRAYGLDQVLERIEVKGFPVKIFADCQEDQNRFFVQPADAAGCLHPVPARQKDIQQEQVKVFLSVFQIEQQRFRAGIFRKIAEDFCLAQEASQMRQIGGIVLTDSNLNHKKSFLSNKLSQCALLIDFVYLCKLYHKKERQSGDISALQDVIFVEKCVVQVRLELFALFCGMRGKMRRTFVVKGQ